MNSMYRLLAGAIDDPRGDRSLEKGFTFAFTEGDLRQLALQLDFLRSNGFEVGSVNVYPAVKTEEEYKRGLKLFWDHRVAGWWNYGRKFGDNGICTPEEFAAALKAL